MDIEQEGLEAEISHFEGSTSGLNKFRRQEVRAGTGEPLHKGCF